ncbi:helix-turn-helix domain-containing protein [Paenibacillus bovis]|uniref:HTH cro/C1-type domain-containing protein n=1 Tax=Paenibacillus bovis TaxID=1616788 RepID=A0A1X9T403_9BACL|nr:helix-turn-helix transcriptional regulator [Paenibacillus bovis]ARR10700.1 hypothetical protein AR543_p0092 [Paenibacillus bovis]
MASDFVDLVRNIMINLKISSTQLSELSGVNKGNISDALNNYRIPFKVFYKIAKALDLQVDQHLKPYLRSRFADKRGAWRFVKTAFQESLNLEEFTIALMIIDSYLDSEEASLHLKDIFMLVDTFYKEQPQLKKDFLPVYDKLSQLQPKSKTDTDTIMSVINYRKLSIRISTGDKLIGDINYWLNYTMTSSMPPRIRINALLEICRLLLFYHEDWPTLDLASQRLITLVEHILKMQNSSYSFDELDEPLPDPLVRYYGQGFIMQTSVHNFYKRFDKAEELIEKYRDLSWFPELDDEGWIHVERFKMFAKANTFYFQLEKGNLSIIPEYMNYLKDYSDDELLPAIRQIVEVANRYQQSISKDVIDKAYELIILRSDLANHESYYAKEKLIHEYLKLICALSKYLFRSFNYQKGMDMALRCFEVSLNFRNRDMILKSMGLIENYKGSAALHQMEDYANIRERMSDYAEVS